MSEGFIGFLLIAAAGLPLAIFDAAFLPPTEAALSLGALAAGFALWCRHFRSARRIDKGVVLLCVCLAMTLCLLGGELHLFSPTTDWIVRDAVLHDLVVSQWPVHYDVGGQDFLLRAPLGMYLVPAAFGKLFGLVAAHYALFLQSAAIFAGLLMIFTARCNTWRKRLVTLTIFIFFSGLDILPWAKSWLFGEPVGFVWHLESWVAWLQYSSHITQLFWVPHHAFAGWGFIAAYLSWRRGELSALSLGAVFALCIFWSPLAMIGALPFLAFALITDMREGRFRFSDAISPVLIGASSLPMIAYLVIDSGAVEKRWLLVEAGYPLRYAEFIIVELVLWFWIFYNVPRDKDETFRTADIMIAGVSLLLLPLYSIGFANDFTMRASIPALALVALAAAPRVMRMLDIPGARRAVLIAGLIAAAVTPAVEIARAVTQPTIAFADCNFLGATKDWMKTVGATSLSTTNYLANADTGLLDKLLVKPAEKINGEEPCGPKLFAFPFMAHEARKTEPHPDPANAR